LLSAFGTNCSP